MARDLIQKLSLGTAQFGLDYGIANTGGRIPKQVTFAILNYAYKKGVDTLDTAYSYGRSEEVIGEFMKENQCFFKVISKLPALNKIRIKINKVEDIIYTTLSRLDSNNIYGYLIHDFESFLEDAKAWQTLQSLKGKGIIKKLGFSLYTISELKKLLDNRVNFDILQIPYSIFDRRFVPYFPILKKLNVELHARSVFLQGLVFLKSTDLPDNLFKAKQYIDKLQDLSKENLISVNALCLNFVLLNSYLDKVIIGIDSLNHLEENLAGINLIERTRNLLGNLKELSIWDEDVLLPYRWVRT